MRMERTVREIAGDYAVLENETGGTTEVALALLPDGIAEGTVLIFENFEYCFCEKPMSISRWWKWPRSAFIGFWPWAMRRMKAKAVSKMGSPRIRNGTAKEMMA